jgi:hypothetical protein
VVVGPQHEHRYFVVTVTVIAQNTSDSTPNTFPASAATPCGPEKHSLSA